VVRLNGLSTGVRVYWIARFRGQWQRVCRGAGFRVRRLRRRPGM